MTVSHNKALLKLYEFTEIMSVSLRRILIILRINTPIPIILINFAG